MSKGEKKLAWPLSRIKYPCVALIGMPGSGKSTLARDLGKAIHWPWIDTDHLLEAWFGVSLEELRQKLGLKDFLSAEEELVSGLDVQRCVIATGGSVVYGTRAMARLRDLGWIVYLEADYAYIAQRVAANPNRGLAMDQGQDLYDLFEERRPLYERYGQFKVRTDYSTIEQSVTIISDWMKDNGCFADKR